MSEENYVPRRNHWQVGWKHMLPLSTQASTKLLPSNSLLIQMIREPLAWINSMVTSSYSLKSAEGMQKGNRRLKWLTQSVKVDPEENIYINCVFSDAIDLWACYAHGYLSGRSTAGETTKFTTIGRHGDLVAYPTKIINGLALKKLRRKVVDGSHPKVIPIDSYVGGYLGTKSSREGALEAITRGRFIEPAEMRQLVISQAQRRSTLVGLLGYIPHTYAVANNRPMVWL